MSYVTVNLIVDTVYCGLNSRYLLIDLLNLVFNFSYQPFLAGLLSSNQIVVEGCEGIQISVTLRNITRQEIVGTVYLIIESIDPQLLASL